MLAAVIANLQNVGPQPSPQPQQAGSGGGAGVGGPDYEIVDYISAFESFTEVAGEHPVARVARRTAHLSKWLPIAKHVRERREGAAFLAGAQITELERRDRERRTMEEMSAIYDALQAAKTGGAPALPLLAPKVEVTEDVERGASASSPVGPILLGIGVIAGIAWFTRRRRRT